MAQPTIALPRSESEPQVALGVVRLVADGWWWCMVRSSKSFRFVLLFFGREEKARQIFCLTSKLRKGGWPPYVMMMTRCFYCRCCSSWFYTTNIADLLMGWCRDLIRRARWGVIWNALASSWATLILLTAPAGLRMMLLCQVAPYLIQTYAAHIRGTLAARLQLYPQRRALYQVPLHEALTWWAFRKHARKLGCDFWTEPTSPCWFGSEFPCISELVVVTSSSRWVSRNQNA